jgi:hypothetical protein
MGSGADTIGMKGVARCRTVDPLNDRISSFSKRSRFPVSKKISKSSLSIKKVFPVVTGISPKEAAKTRRLWQIPAITTVIDSPVPQVGKIKTASAPRLIRECNEKYEWQKRQRAVDMESYHKNRAERKAKVIHQMNKQIQEKTAELNQALKEKRGWLGIGSGKKKRQKEIQTQLANLQQEKETQLLKMSEAHQVHITEQKQLQAEWDHTYTKQLAALNAQQLKVVSAQLNLRTMSKIRFGAQPTEYQITPLSCAPRRVVRYE